MDTAVWLPPATAGTLLDLATFARAAFLYDRLLVLPGATGAAMELSAALGTAVVQPLPVRTTVDELGALTGVGAVRGNLFDSTMTELDRVLRAGSGSALRHDAKAIAEGWSTLLGRRISPRMALNGTFDEARHWDSNGPGLVHRLTGAATSTTTAVMLALIGALQILGSANTDSPPCCGTGYCARSSGS